MLTIAGQTACIMLWFALSYVGLFRFASQPRLPLPVERVFIGRRYAHDQLQELFLVVASRLVKCNDLQTSGGGIAIIGQACAN
jgi:hypothetical protein